MERKMRGKCGAGNVWVYAIFYALCAGQGRAGQGRAGQGVWVGSAIAGPDGGIVVSGGGSIDQAGLNTTIIQSTQNMAIDWQSYNVAVDERVQYIQPNSSSVSLNRIPSQNGSTISGRIDANGQVDSIFIFLFSFFNYSNKG